MLSRNDFESRHPRRVADATTLPEGQSSVIDGSIAIDRDTTLRGIITGSVVVRRGAQLSLYGVVRGSLTLEPGAVAYVTGVVRGDLNLKGSAIVAGSILGNLITKNGAELSIEGSIKGKLLKQPEPPWTLLFG
jgi:cytoskeletal protein CcmA (bactofilin family)